MKMNSTAKDAPILKNVCIQLAIVKFHTQQDSLLYSCTK